MAKREQQRTSGAPARRLSRELIVQTALEQIDRSGAQRLSMRTLAQELGVEAMALYRYVQGKEDLLESVVASLMGDLTSDLDETLTQHWQGFLQAVAHRTRRIAVEHPKAFPLVATRHPAAPWLRPPLRSVEVVDTFLRTLIEHGLTDEQAVNAYRSFSSFLLGQLLLESSVRGAEVGPPDAPIDEGEGQRDGTDAQISLASVPELRRLRPLLSEDRSDEEFETSLERVLDQIETELSH